MSFKPIPRRILIHEVIYTPFIETNSGWGGDSESKSEVIKRVRFEPSKLVRKTNVNEEKLVKGTLFIDAKYSKPFIELEVNSVVEYKGKSLIVESCDPIYEKKDTPHHYEVILI